MPLEARSKRSHATTANEVAGAFICIERAFQVQRGLHFEAEDTHSYLLGNANVRLRGCNRVLSLHAAALIRCSYSYSIFASAQKPSSRERNLQDEKKKIKRKEVRPLECEFCIPPLTN